VKFLIPLLFFLALGGSLSQKGKREFSFVFSPLPYRKEWAMPFPSATIQALLKQRFTYLGSGAQVVAFLGEDQKTVLKLFKMNHLLPKERLKLFPWTSAYKEKKTTLRKKKLKRFFKSVKLAYQRAPEETSLLYARLNPDLNSEYRIILIDRMKRSHTIDLKYVPFVLQRRAELVFSRLKRHLIKGDSQALQRDREKILSLVRRRCEKGLFDGDRGVSANFGFVGESAVQIDVGAFFLQIPTEKEVFEEIRRVDDKIDQWIKRQG